MPHTRSPLRHLLLIGAALAASGCATRGSLVFDCPDLQPQPVVATGLDAVLNCNAPGQAACQAGSAMMAKDRSGSDDFADDIASAIAAAPERLDAQRRKLAPSALDALPPARTDVLLLSGGGQWGAFGAGLLHKLHERGPAHPDNPIERAAVVTGISTGSMQSLYVAGHHGGFTDAFPKMVLRYQPLSESEIVDRDWEPLAVIKGSIAGLKPLRRTVEAALDETSTTPDGQKMTLLEAIARSPVPAFVGFVDFGANQLMTVDLRRLAGLRDGRGRSAGRTARACVTAVALASAAIPMRFQQVRIRHHDAILDRTVDRTYVDGGVNRGVFMARIADGVERGTALLAKSGASRGVETGVRPSLYVVRNGPTYVEVARRRDRLDGRSYGAITAVEETISAMVNRMEKDAIIGLRVDHPTGPIRFVTANGFDRFVWADGNLAPQTGCVRKTDGTMFDPGFMRCLVAYGGAMAERGPWTELPEAGRISK